MHNLWFFQDLMRRIREAIAEDRMLELMREVRAQWSPLENPNG